MAESEKVNEFNKKTAELIKNAKPEDIAEILKSKESLITTAQDNQNQNG